jgi:hypothetical protein
MSQNALFKSQHENFDPTNNNEINKSNRVKVIRQDRKNVEHLNCFFEAGNTKYQVIDINPFGLALRSNENLDLCMLRAGTLVIDTYEVAEPAIKFVRKTGENGDYIHAFEVIGEPISISRIDGVEKAKQFLGKLQSSIEADSKVPEQFSAKVLFIKNWLECLQSEINGLSEQIASYEVTSKSEYEDAIIELTGEYLNKALPADNAQLSVLLSGLSASQIKECVEYFRKKLYDLIYQAPFANRTFHKPLGYAGDYEMMNIMPDFHDLCHSIS